MKDGRLEVSDLMIGDWVDANGHKEIVEQIERHVLTTNDWAYDWKESVIKPIPLTKEILEKNGFKLSVDFGNVYSLKESQRFWAVYVSEGVYALSCQSIDSTFANIRYVHELQHALRLCGITREIIL